MPWLGTFATETPCACFEDLEVHFRRRNSYFVADFMEFRETLVEFGVGVDRVLARVALRHVENMRYAQIA